MAEQKLYTYVAVGILFSLVMAGGASMVGYMNDNFGSNQDTSFGNTFNVIDNITKDTQQLTSYLDGSGNTSNAGSFILNTLETPIKLMFNTFKIFVAVGKDLLSEVPFLDDFGITFVGALQVLFLVLIVFIFIGLVWRNNKAV